MSAPFSVPELNIRCFSPKVKVFVPLDEHLPTIQSNVILKSYTGGHSTFAIRLADGVLVYGTVPLVNLIIILQFHALHGSVIELELADFWTHHLDEVDGGKNVAPDLENAAVRVLLAGQAV